MHLTILRSKRYPDSIGVFGRILVAGQHFSACVENGDTLTPPGDYILVPHDSPHHPDTLAFVNAALGVFHQPSDVPADFVGRARTDCLIHNANLPIELEGCCAPGEAVAIFPADAIKAHPEGGRGVTRSIDTMNRLRALLGGREGHTAEIIEQFV